MAPFNPFESSSFLFGLATSISFCTVVQYLRYLIHDIYSLVNSELFKSTGDKLLENASLTVGSSPGPRRLQQTSTASYVSLQDVNEEPFNSLGKEFMISSGKLRELVRALMKEMREGLANPKNNSQMKMLPSFFTSRPKGDEVGSYYSLDVGGTNFRICEVMLEGGGRVRHRQDKHTITPEMKTMHVNELFDNFAQLVSGFLEKHRLDSNTSRKLGLTFSFPVEQVSISDGIMIQWNKGFVCPGAVGNNVTELINDAFKRNGVKMKVTALVNDTVGTLISHAYSDPQAHIAVVLGTGTNAAYYEDMRNITKLGFNSKFSSCKEMIVNTEWGDYGDSKVLPLTLYDVLLDKNSVNPGRQIYEKLISGMYLGEIVRYALVDLYSRKQLFVGSNLSEDFKQEYAFETAYMSRIERDHSSELLDTRNVIENIFNQQDTTFRDRAIVKHVCQLVAIRSARLAAAGIAAIVTKINRLHDCTVVVDGTLFESYPHFANRIRDTLYDIIGASSENIILDQAKSGSGRGSAIAVAFITDTV